MNSVRWISLGYRRRTFCSDRPGASPVVKDLRVGLGRYRYSVLFLPSARSAHPSKPTSEPTSVSTGAAPARATWKRTEPVSVRRFAAGFAVLALVVSGCSTKTADKPVDASTESSTVSLVDSSVAASNDTGAVSPATPADSDAVVAATPADSEVVESVATAEGPAPVAVNQITGDDLVPVVFDFPDTARPIKEVDRPVADGTKRLALKVSGLTYHGVVCGFSIKGTRPESPAIIRMTGTKADGTGFDSGPVSVAWTSTEPPEVSSGGADNNGWNFLSDANANRSGPGWVVSLGGVTPNVAGAIPKTTACSLELGVGTFSAVNGPIGYWAGFARN